MSVGSNYYQSFTIFLPKQNYTYIYTARPITGDEVGKNIINPVKYSDPTQNNYRHLVFSSTDVGSTTEIKIKGYTFYDTYVEETITLYGADNKFSDNLYNRITYLSASVADPGINVGFGSGTSNFVLGNGCKTNQTVYMTTTGVGTSATVYGLISKDPLPIAQINLFRYELSTELTNLSASLVPNFSYVQAPFGQCYIDTTVDLSSTTQNEDIYWMVGLQELL